MGKVFKVDFKNRKLTDSYQTLENGNAAIQANLNSNENPYPNVADLPSGWDKRDKPLSIGEVMFAEDQLSALIYAIEKEEEETIPDTHLLYEMERKFKIYARLLKWADTARRMDNLGLTVIKGGKED